MHLRQLWLTNVRSYEEASVEFSPGLTAVVGDNGRGKTNLLEAIAYLATLKSFRGSPTDSLVRAGALSGVIRAEVVREQRELLIEAELVPGGRSRIQVNKQRVPRIKDLLGALRVTVFSPDDLVLVKGGPAGRRDYLDATLVAVHVRNDALLTDLDRILRQRNALLKQGRGRLDADTALTLDVFDTKLAMAGEAIVAARQTLLADVGPRVQQAYAELAQRPATVDVTYVSSWSGPSLAEALAAGRDDDVRRGVSLVGPHRDELAIDLDGMPARTHASQGEQRSLALALRLASHHVVMDAVDEPPVLLLDDVFSELDPDRSAALLVSLPPGQAILTSASGMPPGAAPDRMVRVEADPISGVSVVSS